MNILLTLPPLFPLSAPVPPGFNAGRDALAAFFARGGGHGLLRDAAGDAGGGGMGRSAVTHTTMLKKPDGGVCRCVDQTSLGASAPTGPTGGTGLEELR